MSETPKQFVLEARELLAVECEKSGWKGAAFWHRQGIYDNGANTRVLARVLFERPQPTFDQRSLAMIRALNDVHSSFRSGHNMTVAYDAHLAEIMHPKVDPLEAAINSVWEYSKGLEHMPKMRADQLRKALADRGLEIAAKGDVA